MRVLQRQIGLQSNQRMSAPIPIDLVETMSKLLAALGGQEGPLVSALLEGLSRVEVGVAVKEVATGRYLLANGAMANFLGRSLQEILGSTDAELIEPGQAALLRVADQAASGRAAALPIEHRIERAAQRREFSVSRMVIPGPVGGAPSHLCSLWVETTQARQRDAQLQKLMTQLEQQQTANESLRRESQDPAVRDDTMGLYQRTHFDDQLRREADLSAREHRQFSLVAIELDPLAASVLELGADGRARILEALGRLLRSNTRAMDASCRVDENRFSVLLSGVGLATAHARMEGLRRQCATQIVAFLGKDLGFSVAMGVASFPHTAANHEALVEAADTALAEAIRRGGNRVALAGIRFEQS